jgi:uncharacterized protein (DUF433 family)
MARDQIDWSQCPMVESIPDKLSGAPVLKGTRMPVQGVLDNYDAGLTPAEVAATFGVPLRDVIHLLAYREKQLERSV